MSRLERLKQFSAGAWALAGALGCFLFPASLVAWVWLGNPLGIQIALSIVIPAVTFAMIGSSIDSMIEREEKKPTRVN